MSWGAAFVMSSPVERDPSAERRAPVPRPPGRACSCPRRWRRARRRPTRRARRSRRRTAPGPIRTARRGSRPTAACRSAVASAAPVSTFASRLRRLAAASVRFAHAFTSSVRLGSLDRLVVAEVGGAHGGVVADLVGGAVRDPHTEVEHRHLARQAEHHRHVVLDEQQRDLLLVDDGAQRAAELRGLVTVESRRRLVEQHDRRAGRERACDLDPSRGAEREHRRRGVGDAAEVEQVDEVVDAFLLVCGARVQRARGDEIAPQPPALVAHAVPEHDVLAHGQAHEQLELLERAGQPEPRPLRRRRARDPAAGEEHVALLGPQQAGQHAEERGLARAVGPDEPDDAGGRHRQAHVAQGDQTAEAHGHVAGLDRRARRPSPSAAVEVDGLGELMTG